MASEETINSAVDAGGPSGSAGPGGPTEERLLRLDAADDCLVATRLLRAGETVLIDGVPVELDVDLLVGHKLAAPRCRPGRRCASSAP